MTDAHGTHPRRHSEDKSAEPSGVDQDAIRREQRSWTELLGRTAFEILVVAVGVMLALAADEWRERSEQKELADQARAALRAEILSNREAILSRLRRTSQLYGKAAVHPERVSQYVVERQNRPLELTDAAWRMTVEAGAIRWLDPIERARVAEVYASHERMRDLVFEEMLRWTELAAFSPTPASGEMREERDRAIRVWQAFAQRAQLSLCINVGRHERALGAKVDVPQFSDFCAKRRPDEDPAAIYVEWRNLGWVSTTPPRIITKVPAEP